MQKISPFLWFDQTAEEAVNFYVSVFADAKIGKVMRASAAGPGPEGRVLTIGFELFGQSFTAFNFPTDFKFTEAVSFVVDCKDQAEVDYYWDCLSDGGQPRDCGWVKDRFGVFWQITPTRLIELMSDPNPAIAARAATAMMTMQKIDIAALERAVADG
ncbi:MULTISPECIES: VOC family protein [Thalassospira]|jgi:predicted 3-demethylubiquinone-9 3-methyltransferase (glyoxalase superfamily)|uniref:VOC family protein n=1 Tax=Thalassospira indica TaxID=1891279 RepID=A0ABM6XUP9_9PROT|nr:VOC family protein [Thalassospira indica]AXO13055.1 VOC family protein [Thalassospira indica]OAZ15091.1 3-demethylubiquinone-9 3-methyltransferase [Thalassospira profundimaris]